MKIEAFGKMALLEYFILLDKRLGEVKKEVARAKK
jgi:hypothetical protein